MTHSQKILIMLYIAILSACSSQPTVQQGSDSRASSKGGYYLDDGPGDNPPADIDSIPDARPQTEKLLTRSNRPYKALGQNYVPMTSYAPYVREGIASWYGRRYHGKKTSSGEIYDMYGMTGAHPTLPIPSYVRVTNPKNKRSVIVRINDRGPFKQSRLIDLSYAAAYKLRLIEQGSGPVQIEWIDTRPEALLKADTPQVATAAPVEITPIADTTSTDSPAPAPALAGNMIDNNPANYYVQVGAFKNESNGDLLQKKIIGLDLAGDATVTNVYNNGIYRVKLGPFGSRTEADFFANKVRRQLNTSAIVINQ